jgi:hypothetical protein
MVARIKEYTKEVNIEKDQLWTIVLLPSDP